MRPSQVSSTWTGPHLGIPYLQGPLHGGRHLGGINAQQAARGLVRVLRCHLSAQARVLHLQRARRSATGFCFAFRVTLSICKQPLPQIMAPCFTD